MRQSYTLKILKDAKVRGNSKAGDVITTLLDVETLQIQLDAGNVEVIGDAIPAEPEPTPEPREPSKQEVGSSKPKGRGHSKGTS